jgi:hypothetical protein
MTTTLLLDKFQRLTHKKARQDGSINTLVFGRKMGLMSKLFGCWHKNISRPFSQGKTSYRNCLDCGARRQFNPETLKTYGHFHFPPVITEERDLTEKFNQQISQSSEVGLER